MSKIDIFADKEYEEMEWLNKAIEPFIFPLNELISRIPNEYVFTYEDIVAIYTDHNSAYVTSMIRIVSNQLNLGFSDSELETILEFVELNVSDDYSINLQSQEITGEFKLTKIKHMLNDDEIKLYLANYMKNSLYSNCQFADAAKYNELMDIVGCSEQRSSKSVHRKKSAFIARMVQIIEDDLWKIRSATLIEKLVEWICNYVNNGNLASLSNITRLKCMTYTNNPIYSMQETV